MIAGGGYSRAGAYQSHLSLPEMTEIHGHQVRSLLTHTFVDFLTVDRLLTIIMILDPLRLPCHGLNC